VCASWSDHGLHTRGSLEGFERIGSRDKWLFTHGRRKWETFYSPEACQLQRRFFDRYLKGEANGMETTQRVRLEVRKTRDQQLVRSELRWPLSSVHYRPLYLNARTGRLADHAPYDEAIVTYRAMGRRTRDRASFVYKFARATELTGSMALKLWVSTTDGDDLDLFVLLRKFDAADREVFFYGYNGFARDGVAKGWLRASHRQLDADRSRPGRPWHTHRVSEPLAHGEIAPVEIEVLASSTLFEAGSSLRVEVLGHDAAKYPAFRHRRTVNRGCHGVHTGGRHDSYLLAPFVEAHA
jgi:putative CocE/NonD family hydrolase